MPGAPGPWGTERALPCIWGIGWGFRGGCRIWHASGPARSASLRATREVRGKIDLRSAEWQRRVEESQIGFAPRRTEAVRRGLRVYKFQQNGGPTKTQHSGFRGGRTSIGMSELSA